MTLPPPADARRHRSLALVLALLLLAPLLVGARGPRVAFGTSLGGVERDMRAELVRIEQGLERRVEYVRVFQRWDDTAPSEVAELAASGRRDLVASLMPRTADGVDVPWASIAAARQGDAAYERIASWARSLRDTRRNVIAVFNHEPEIEVNASLGTSDEFVAAFRRFHQIVDRHGGRRVKVGWVTTAMAHTYPDTDRRAAVHFYPGDRWVDWIGADAYNHGTCRWPNGAWRSPEEVLAGFRAFAAERPRKPALLAEVASHEDASRPGAKAAWVDALAEYVDERRIPSLRAVLWFHSVDGDCDWWMDSSPSSLDALAAFANGPKLRRSSAPRSASVDVAVVADRSSRPDVRWIRRHLRAEGLSVTFVADHRADHLTLRNAGAVLVADSARSRRLPPELAHVPQPLLAAAGDVGRLIGVSRDDGQVIATDRLWFPDTGSSLAGGVQGRLDLGRTLRLPTATRWRAPTVVAEAARRTVALTFDAGARLADDRVAPGCRGFHGALGGTGRRMSDDAAAAIVGGVAAWLASCS